MYEENTFTKIINKEIEANIFYETSHTVIIYDNKPQAKVHLLLLPKKNYIDYVDFLQNALINEKQDMENALLYTIDKLHLKNSKLITNCGKNAGQEIFHFHIHLLSF